MPEKISKVVIENYIKLGYERLLFVLFSFLCPFSVITAAWFSHNMKYSKIRSYFLEAKLLFLDGKFISENKSKSIRNFNEFTLIRTIILNAYFVLCCITAPLSCFKIILVFLNSHYVDMNDFYTTFYKEIISKMFPIALFELPLMILLPLNLILGGLMSSTNLTFARALFFGKSKTI